MTADLLRNPPQAHHLLRHPHPAQHRPQNCIPETGGVLAVGLEGRGVLAVGLEKGGVQDPVLRVMANTMSSCEEYFPANLQYCFVRKMMSTTNQNNEASVIGSGQEFLGTPKLSRGYCGVLQ